MTLTRQRTAARTLSAAVTSLLIASLGVVLSGAQSSAAERIGPGVDERAGRQVTLEPTTTTTRPAAARRAAGYRAYPVPTSGAGVGNIVTAPSGDMWFVMEKANKIGRITPTGKFTEVPLGETTTGEGTVKDLAVAPDGSIWVVYDSGWHIMHIDAGLTNGTVYRLGAYPYGEDVELGPDGVPWVSMRFDETGLARVLPTGVVWHSNAPPCDRALARARDGGMWCQSELNKLILSNSDASAGTTYPLPSRATDVRGLAAGPVGDIWFSRYSSTMFTSPARGDIGWIDRATGRTTIFDTGSRTGPKDLLQGPDGNMWFTNRGVGKGIGHISARGRGALSKVGSYEPNHLTFDHQGFLWFTDAENNSIVRVDPADLRVTNVEVGTGSVFTPKPGAHPPGSLKARAKVVGKVRAGKKPLRVRKNRVRVRVACPKGAKSACKGIAVLRHKKKARAFSKAKTYKVKAGRKKLVALKLNKAGKKAVKRKPRKIRVSLITRAGDAVRDKRIRVRR